jgi:hypothetical protein
MIHIDLPKDRPGVRALGAYLNRPLPNVSHATTSSTTIQTLLRVLHVRQIQAIVNHCQLQVANQNKALHRWPDDDIDTWARDPF